MWVDSLYFFYVLIQDSTIQNEDCSLSFGILSLCTDFPVEEVLQVIRNILNTNPSSPEHSLLQVEDVMELLGVCLTTTHFQFEDRFYQ
jgi:hypothetical protein